MTNYYIIPWPIFTPKSKTFIIRKISLLLSLYHTRETNMLKHDSFDKNWNIFFWNWCWYLSMNMFIEIGTLDTYRYHVSIFKSKLKHEQRKYLHHWFQDRIFSVIHDIIGCITQKILVKKPYSLMENKIRSMFPTIVLIVSYGLHIFLFNFFSYAALSIFLFHSVKREWCSIYIRLCSTKYLNYSLKLSTWKLS